MLLKYVKILLEIMTEFSDKLNRCLLDINVVFTIRNFTIRNFSNMLTTRSKNLI